MATPPASKPVPIFKEDYPASKRATAAQPGCNWAMADDLLLATVEGSRQNLHWQRTESERQSRAKGLVGRRIAPVL